MKSLNLIGICPLKYLDSVGISKETTAKAASTVVSRFLSSASVSVSVIHVSHRHSRTSPVSGHETHPSTSPSDTTHEKKKKKKTKREKEYTALVG